MDFILQAGSSLNPTFLFVVDVTFGVLLLVLVCLAILASGNLHLVALTGVGLGLWICIKW